jgi:hypothetical protein
MFTRHITHIATTAIGAAAIGLAAAGTAGAAVGSVDDMFFAQVKSAGIQFASPQAAATQAHRVCAALAAGHTGSYASAKVVALDDLNAQRASYFVVVATHTYCPQFSAQLN